MVLDRRGTMLLAVVLLAGCASDAGAPSLGAATRQQAVQTAAPTPSQMPSPTASPTASPTPAPTPPPFDVEQLADDLRTGAATTKYPDASEAAFQAALHSFVQAHGAFAARWLPGDAQPIDKLVGAAVTSVELTVVDTCLALLFDRRNEAEYHTADLTGGCAQVMARAVSAANEFGDAPTVTLATAAIGMIVHGYLADDQSVRGAYAITMRALGKRVLPG